MVQTTRYSGTASAYITRYAKYNDFYSSLVTVYKQASLTICMRLHSNGFIDSVYSARADKTVKSTSNYVACENDNNTYYENENYTYWLNNLRNFAVPSQRRQSSIVFELTGVIDKVQSGRSLWQSFPTPGSEES